MGQRGRLMSALSSRQLRVEIFRAFLSALALRLQEGGGRYGLFYAGVPYGTASSTSAWLYGLQQNPETRSNLAFVNTGETDGNPDSFTIDLFDGDTGSKVNTVEGISLDARGWKQIGGILAQYAPGTTQGFAKITRKSGANPFITYGVINDGGQPGQRTGDGAFVSSLP